MANNNFCRLFFSHDNIPTRSYLNAYSHAETLIEAAQSWGAASAYLLCHKILCYQTPAYETFALRFFRGQS